MEAAIVGLSDTMQQSYRYDIHGGANLSIILALGYVVNVNHFSHGMIN